DAVLLRLACRRLGRHLGGVRGGLARALEPDDARRRPAQNSTGRVGDGDDGVVEGRLDVGLTDRDILLLFATRLTNRRLGCCQCSLLRLWVAKRAEWLLSG